VSTCPACGREVPGEFAFCPFCGSATGVVPATASVGDRERRVVTVLFCDLVGFTSASEQADVEDVQRRLAVYHDRVRERVEAFGGVV
jgi:class 3 adenylate cyclase